MRKLAAVIVLYGCATGCGGSTTPAGPTAVPSPVQVTIALTGSVRDATDNTAVADAMVQIANGPDIEKYTMTDAAGNFTLPGVHVGAFVLRFSRSGFQNLDRTISASQDTRVDVQLQRGPACPALPAPTGMRVQVVGSTVTYMWNAVPGADDYILGVGTSSGSSRTRSTNTTQLEYVWRGMTSGTYYARIVARNACVRSNASNEVQFTVGS